MKQYFSRLSKDTVPTCLFLVKYIFDLTLDNLSQYAQHLDRHLDILTEHFVKIGPAGYRICYT